MTEIEKHCWKYTKDPVTGCWIWHGAVGGIHHPRPQIRYKGKTCYVSQVFWEVLHGSPENLFVCHSCDNRMCVNPAHLYLGTQKQNMQAASRKGRFSGQTAAMNEEKAEQIRELRKAGHTYASIAKLTGVPLTSVAYIAVGERW